MLGSTLGLIIAAYVCMCANDKRWNDSVNILNDGILTDLYTNRDPENAEINISNYRPRIRIGIYLICIHVRIYIRVVS